MMYRLTAIAALALAACAGGSEVALDGADTEEVVALSEAAVTESTHDDAVSSAILDEAVPMQSGETLQPEELVEEEAAPTGFTYELRRGETLAHFARWSEVPVEEIADASGLDLAGSYPVGTEIVVPILEEDKARLDSLRDEHKQRRVDGYLASRGGSTGVETLRVRTGDTAWKIAKDNQGIPVWLLEAYNPGVDLETLRPGMELQVPVLADIVVDAGE